MPKSADNPAGEKPAVNVADTPKAPSPIAAAELKSVANAAAGLASKEEGEKT